jgi:hypothetical protein
MFWCVAKAKFPISFQLKLGGTKMKYLVLLFVVAFAFSSMTMASDIAFYVGAPNVDGWYDVAAMTADVETIITETGSLFKDIQQFDDTQFDEFGAWVDENTDDGEMDILWLNGCVPSVLYPFPNLEPDGSRIEEWLDGGNMIINVGDWFGYVSYEGGPRQTENTGTGAANILDLSSGIIVSADNTSLTVTSTGQEYLPSLGDTVITYRPIVLSAVVAPWEVAAVFAQNAAGTQADPVVIHNTETGAYVAFVNQSAGSGPPTWLDDRGLTCAEFINSWVTEQGLLGVGNPYARRPDPRDGAMLADTWATMSWSPGIFAVSHDLYMGDNFDDVNDGAEGTFQGNQGSTMLIVGFAGFPYPDGLVPGTTYYWRIDEVNDADPNSPWKGPVWSFWIQPRIAYEPVPADGAKFVNPNADLSWTAGLGARLHYVYFGDNFDDVNNATGGLPQPATTYALDTLEPEKTYYWRVDESDGINMQKGDVWIFTTAGASGGLRGNYYNWNDPSVEGTGNPGPVQPFVTLVLTRIDPQIAFPWGDGEPDPLVGADNFSVIWTGEVEAVFTETYTFYTSTDDGARLWINDQQIIDQWIEQGTTEWKGTIDLVAGNTYPIVMEYYENGGGAVAELRWSSPRTPKELIPQSALSLPIKARNPKPSNGATDVKQTATLSWRPGEAAASHQVYFGSDEEAVRNADTTSPEYKGIKALGSESYDPGKLSWNSTYYWRVDEVNNLNPDSPWTGILWSFTTADFIGIDDIEDYNDYPPDEIFSTWIDGWEVPTNGSLAGHPDPPFAETANVHGGRQSMPVYYENNFKYSEITMTLVYPRDWTEEGVGVLSLWFYGDAANAAERMYVNLNGIATVYHSDPSAAQIDTWTEWRIDLQEFAAKGVNLANVNTISIGFGDKNNLQASGSGMVLFDDIRLYRPAPEPEPAP